MQIFSVLAPSGQIIKIVDCSPKSALIAAVAFTQKIIDKVEHSKLESQIEGDETDVLSLRNFMVQPSEATEADKLVGTKGVAPKSAEFMELVSYAGRHRDRRWPTFQENPLVRGLALCVCYDPGNPKTQHRRVVEIGNGTDNASLSDIRNGVVMFAPGVPMFPALVWMNPNFNESAGQEPAASPPKPPSESLADLKADAFPVISNKPIQPVKPSEETTDPLNDEKDDSFEEDDDE